MMAGMEPLTRAGKALFDALWSADEGKAASEIVAIEAQARRATVERLRARVENYTVEEASVEEIDGLSAVLAILEEEAA